MVNLLTEFEKLVKAVCPNLPEGNFIKQTTDPLLYYKIANATRTLYTPTSEMLRSNLNEIDRFCEAANAFAMQTKWPTPESWQRENITEFTDHGDEAEALHLIPSLNGAIDIACDIETRRVEYTDNKVLAIGFSITENTAISITCFTPRVLAALQHIFWNKKFNFIWHNGKFDTTRLKYLLNLDARVDNDTILMHYACINEKRGTHKLKELAQLYLQAPAWEDELTAYKKTWCRDHKKLLRDFTYDMIPVSVLVPYLHRDCIATFRLYKLFKKLQRPESVFIYEKLIIASNIYRDIELAGIELNQPKIETLKIELTQKRAAAEIAMQEVIDAVWNPINYCRETGAKLLTIKKSTVATGAKLPLTKISLVKQFNPGSPKQLKWLLETLLNKKISSTDKAALDELAIHAESIDNELGKKFILAIRDMRQADKYLDTYVLGVESLCCEDNRVRCSFNLYGTETGRLSSSDPNMQNIPRNKSIKNIFTVKPGYIFVQLDYSQAELRVLAALSGDQVLRQIYLDGRDLHNEMATKIHGPDFTVEQRVIIKSVNFGIAYGRGPQSIADMYKLPISETQQIIKDWYSVLPEVEKYIKSKRLEPERGIASTTIFGRVRHFVITNENRYHVQNESINFPIQSTASDLTLFSLIEIVAEVKKRGLDARVVNTVHDSIILEVIDDPKVVKEIVTLGKEIMKNVPKPYFPTVPFKADADTGYTWGDLEKLEAE